MRVKVLIEKILMHGSLGFTQITDALGGKREVAIGRLRDLSSGNY